MARIRGLRTLGCLACFVLIFPITEESRADEEDSFDPQFGTPYISQRTKEEYDSEPSTGGDAGFNTGSLEEPYIFTGRNTKDGTLDTNPSRDLLELKRLSRKLTDRRRRRKHKYNHEDHSRIFSTPPTTKNPGGPGYGDSEKSIHHSKVISQRTKEHIDLQTYNKGDDDAENTPRMQGEHHQTTTATVKESGRLDQIRKTKEKEKHRQARKNARRKGKKRKKSDYRQDSEAEHVDSLDNSQTTTSASLNNSLTELRRDNSSDLTETERHNATRDHFRKIYLEILKKKILQKLGLEAPPNVTKHLPMLPDNFLGEFALKDEPRKYEDENVYAKPSQAVLFASQDPLPCPQAGAKCVSFKLDHLSGQEVLSAELWLYKQYDPLDHYNHTLVIYELESNKVNEPSIRKIAGTMQTGIKRGWIKLDILDTAAFWIDKPHRNQGIQILCKTCKPGKHRETPVATSKAIRPALVVNFGKGHRRMPRSLIRTCQEKISVCCKETLVVDFKTIGWGEWVLFPKSFESNFCRGSCKNMQDMPHMVPRHTQLMMEMAERTDSDLSDEMQACCSPNKLSGISMMYWINENELVKKDLDGMVVEDCACTV